jgi:hypothetical protein
MESCKYSCEVERLQLERLKILLTKAIEEAKRWGRDYVIIRIKDIDKVL